MYPQMSSPNSRKRAAPGASPVVPIIAPMQQQPFAAPQPDQMLRWNGAAPEGAMYAEAARNGIVNPYMMSPGAGQFGQGAAQAASSTALARRQLGSRALVPTAPRQVFDTSTDWNSFGEDFQQQNQQPQASMPDNESIEALEERALQAKREAMQKRKQIPPFVQKLSSFLEEAKNTELIRWSDNGDSFVVLDEEEFAKKLIPELFKHNNYASFVRQLNMYGFHKRVGLSDNSMKASERKNKSPSEYYNPYFKRGHPNLLWLINKPKSNKNAKNKNAKQGEEMDSDEDGVVDETAYAQPTLPAANNQLHRTVTPADIGPLPPKKDLVLVKNQLEKLQQQQVAISQLIERLRREHAQLMTQAAVFQNQHERHENSINAILNFLANVFRKSLEEQGGAQSVSDLLASIIPGAQQQMPHQGSVVDLGDFDTHTHPSHHRGPQDTPVSSVVSPPKRQPRLLPPIPMPQQGKAATVSPSTTAASTPQPQQYQHAGQFPTGSVSEIFDASPSDSSTPAYIKNELQTNPHEGMMKIINSTNTNSGHHSGSRLDLPDMASKTNATMSHEQRSKMLNMMAGQGHRVSSPAAANTSSSSSASSSVPPNNNNNNNNNNNATSSLSPIISSMQHAAPPPSMYQMQSHQAEIDALQQMQRDQAAKIDELSGILGPLSPLRHIPGMDDDDTGGYFDLNSTSPGGGGGMDDFLNAAAFGDHTSVGGGMNGYPGDGYDMSGGNGNGGGGPMTNSTDGNDFNFGLDGGVDGVDSVDFGGGGDGGLGGHGHNIFDVANSPGQNGTPSPAGTEEIPRDDLGLELDSPGPGSKRRKVQ